MTAELPLAAQPEPAIAAAPACTRGKRKDLTRCPHCGALPLPKLLVSASTVAESFGVALKVFVRAYAPYFTDRRPLKRRGHGVPRMIPMDEVEVYVDQGPEAVIDFRRRKGRLSPEEERLAADGLGLDGKPIRKGGRL